MQQFKIKTQPQYVSFNLIQPSEVDEAYYQSSHLEAVGE